MESFNPWWKREPDLAVQRWSDLQVRWVPQEMSELSLSPFALNFLSGPRQVGKTTMLKLLINQLIVESRLDPRSIFYYSCDELSDYRESFGGTRLIPER